LDGVLADISFEMEVISWSSSEIMGDAGEIIVQLFEAVQFWQAMTLTCLKKADALHGKMESLVLVIRQTPTHLL
jgi:hypothetical protein